MRRTVATLVIAAAVTAGACGSGDDDSASSTTSARRDARPTTTTAPAPTVPAAPLTFSRVTKTFVDRSRATEDPDDTRSASTRTLVTDVYVPAGRGPFPLIVHSHGASGHPRKFTQLASAWARHGYVVVLPAFPLSNDRSGGSVVIGDYVNQADDVHFVIDEVLKLASEDGNELSGKVDADHIGVSGLSLGGATTYGVAFNECCRDERIDATIIMSGIRLPFGDEPFDLSLMPVMIMHGTADTTVGYSNAEAPYADAAAPKYLVTLIGAPHALAYEDAPDAHDEVVIETTTDFWDAYLRGDDAAKAQLLEDANVPGLSSIRSDVGERREN